MIFVLRSNKLPRKNGFEKKINAEKILEPKIPETNNFFS
jgi:hypothetical protein